MPRFPRTASTVAVDEDAARSQEAPLLAMDLTADPIGGAPMRLAELGGAEQAALVDRVERSGREEVERAGDPEVDPMMLERLGGEVSDVDPDRPRPELKQQPAHPRLELRGPPTGDRRPARVRPAGDVEDGPVADRREGAEGVGQPADELGEDRLEVRLRRDLGREAMPRVERPEGAVQQIPVGRRPAERSQASDRAAYAPRPSASPYAQTSRASRSIASVPFVARAAAICARCSVAWWIA